MGKKMQADGDAADGTAPDGVNTAEGAGESQGGAYPRPDDDEDGGFPDRGGQSDMGYEGPDNPNATTDPA